MSNSMIVGLISILIGACLVWYGVLEYQVGSEASVDPVDVELADLEAGGPLPDNHIKIGLHHCMYHLSVYDYDFDGDDETMRPSSPLNWVWSPLISDTHPYIPEMKALIKRHGGLKKIPRDADWPVLKDFVVLLKSEYYETVRDVPGGRKPYKSVSGLVINRIESVGDEEKRLIRKEFPDIDFDKILIVQHGRKPMPVAGSISFIAVGSLLGLIPLVVFFRRLGGSRQTVVASDASEPPEAPESEDLDVEEQAPQTEDSNPYRQT
jgi:hypothetical protein